MLFHIGLGCLAFLGAFATDWLEARYVRAVHSRAEGERSAAERAARCSVAMWLVGAVALVGIVEYGWWLLVPEGLGLYFGSRAALK